MAFKLISVSFLGAALLVSGCANSVANDPQEMARRHAYVERDQARRAAFAQRYFQAGTPTVNTVGSSPAVRAQYANRQGDCHRRLTRAMYNAGYRCT